MVTMYPQPDELLSLCPGQVFTFTCTTQGSQDIYWASDDYIGAGGTQLEFVKSHDIGYTRTSPLHPTTVATLTNKSDARVLESQLCIIAMSDLLISSVSCSTSAIDYRETVILQIIGE